MSSFTTQCIIASKYGVEAKDIFNTIVFGAVEGSDKSRNNLIAYYDDEAEYLELCIPDEYISLLETIIKGPKLELYTRWLIGTDNPATFYFGSGAPDNSIGNNGDIYINTDNNDLYQKESGVWVLKASIGDLSAHLADTNNPHQTTAAQVGADPAGSAAAVQLNLTNHIDDSTIHFLETDIDHDNIVNGTGIYSHTQIDTHINDTSNPHTVTFAQVLAQGNTLTTDLNAGGLYTIVNLPEPQDGTDAANKEYVDSVATGLNVLDAVRVATTADLDTTYDSLNKTLTANSNGAITIDDIVLSINDRILVKDQSGGTSNATENGIYIVTATGDIGNPFILTRASDFDEDSITASEITNGSYVLVEEGTLNEGSGWVLTSPNPIVLDVDDLIWSKFTQQTNIDVDPAGALTLNVNTLSVNVDNSSIEISGNNLRIKNGGVTNAALDKSNIPISGFGAATSSVDMGGERIINLGTPVDNTDAATKGYVLSAAVINVVSVSTTHTASNNEVILANTNAGSFTINLPPAASNVNSVISIKKITSDGNSITIDPNGGETIDGQFQGILDGFNDSVTMVCNGSNWYII